MSHEENHVLDPEISDCYGYLAKTNGELIVVSHQEFQGRERLDIRTFFLDESSQKYLPTKKGLALNMSLVEVFELAVETVQNSLEEGEELEHADVMTGARNFIRVEWKSFKNRPYFDIRAYFIDTKGDLTPTSKGVTIPPKLVSDFQLILAEVITGLRTT